MASSIHYSSWELFIWSLVDNQIKTGPEIPSHKRQVFQNSINPRWEDLTRQVVVIEWWQKSERRFVLLCLEELTLKWYIYSDTVGKRADTRYFLPSVSGSQCQYKLSGLGLTKGRPDRPFALKGLVLACRWWPVHKIANFTRSALIVLDNGLFKAVFFLK